MPSGVGATAMVLRIERRVAAVAARDNGPMDPHAVLGLSADASVGEAARAYRELAKRFHPDRVGDAGMAQMVQLNVAYELLRSTQRPGAGAPVAPAAGGGADGCRPGARRGPGHWLPEAMRRALGRELLDALAAGEHVELVTPTATWASPSTLLGVTDLRPATAEAIAGHVRAGLPVGRPGPS